MKIRTATLIMFRVFLCIALMVSFFSFEILPIAKATTTTTKWVSFKNDNFTGVTSGQAYSFSGTSKVPNGADYLRLTNLTDGALAFSQRSGSYGTIFNQQRIYNQNNFSFSTYFSFKFSGGSYTDPGFFNPLYNPSGKPGADGMAFVIQTLSSNAGTPGGGMGYYGIQPSFAVKFDTYKNPDLGDPSDNYVGIDTTGTLQNVAGRYRNLSDFPSLGIMKAGTNVYHVWIDYDGNAENVKVYMSTSNDRSTAIKVLDVGSIDLSTIFQNQNSVFAGFTASTGGAWENQDLLSWYFTNNLDPINSNDPTTEYKQAPTKVTADPTADPQDPYGKTDITITATDPTGQPVSGVPIDLPINGPYLDLFGLPLSSPPLTGPDGKVHVILDNSKIPPGTPSLDIVAEGGAYTTISAPSAPTGLSFVSPDMTSLTWNSVTGATYYSIYHNGNYMGSTVTGTTYNLGVVAPGVYTVKAVTAGFSSPASSPTQAQITLDRNTYILPVGGTYQTVSTVVYGTYSPIDITNVAQFSSTFTNIATISPHGLITAVAQGTSVINVVYGLFTKQANLTVVPQISNVTAKNVTNTSLTLTWPVTTPPASSYDIYDNGVLVRTVTTNQVDLSGYPTNSHHTYTIIAKTGGQEIAESLPFDITLTDLSNLFLDVNGYTLLVGDTHQTVVNAVYSDRSIRDVSTNVTYTSSNPGVITVDSQGKVTAVGPGTATITITYSGKTVTETIVVNAAEPQYNVTLTTPLDSVVGDGHTQIELIGTVTSKGSGQPVSGVPITFTFGQNNANNQIVSTDANGVARIQYTVPAINGLVPVYETITASAQDPNGATAQKSIEIHYMPASVKGVLIDTATNKPIAGAAVSVSADFDSDGTPDFTAQVVTGTDGSYQIFVPRGDFNYQIKINYTAQVGGRTVQVNTTQSAPVGTLTGLGESITSQTEISGQLLVASHGGSNPPSVNDLFGSGNITAVVTGGSLNQHSFPLDANGNFMVSNVAPGTYSISYQVKAPDNTILAGPSVQVTVNENGSVSFVNSLIDPYGIVTNENGAPLPGTTMTLYYANTPLNIANHHTPNTIVTLPVLPSFAPNQNNNPQVTDNNGAYGWMVYPDTDYYIIATHPYYPVPYSTLSANVNVPAENGSDSYIQNGIIHVGQTIVSFSFSMPRPYSNSSSSSDVIGKPTNVAATLGSSGSDATITWNTVAGATSYTIYDNGKPIASGITNASYLLSGITVGQTHVITVTAVKNGIEGQASDSITINVPQKLHEGDKGSHKKYIEGYPDETFKPSRSVSRQEVAAMLSRVYELLKSDSEQSSYSDVNKLNWSYDAINAVTKAGFMNGYPDGTFRPEQPITREEVAGIAARLKKLEGQQGKDGFSDISGSWARDAINSARAAGILSGYADGTFLPKANTTRAEMVTVINRVTNRGPLSGVATPSWSDVGSYYWAYEDIEEASTDHQYIIHNNAETLQK
ncbi:hypothetical protein A8709_06445 [Paenibacillus pectinilyticus]|uniref:Intimin n=1 Tax=Paenibacillus pectinilyticus TaxID=512399 RepID=A0A1C0ZTA1_9BACL|nr:S-layer homology domain-containing protein [Paenibacillus pectinilyticus]OCT11310.1 hypothetical protein A8709_06445 [Paenibacillus pectinilyticus]